MHHSHNATPASGHLHNFQDPNVTDDRGETAAFKASRNCDLPKLEILELGCADFNKADAGPKQSELSV